MKSLKEHLQVREERNLCISDHSFTSPSALSWFSHLTTSTLVVQSSHHQHSPGSVISPPALLWFSHLTTSTLLVQSSHYQHSRGSVISPPALSWFSHLATSTLLVQSPHHQHSPWHTCRSSSSGVCDKHCSMVFLECLYSL